MHARRLTTLLVTLAALALPAVAGAAKTANVGVRDFDYLPSYLRVDPGDTVNWNVLPGQNHTITTQRGRAPVPFDSGEKEPGQSFSFLFADPGRYDYFCTIHPTLQKGVVQVGPDMVAPALRRFRVAVGETRFRAGFRLSEEARVKAVVKRNGRVTRTVRTKLLGPGARSLLVPAGLQRLGDYRLTVTATDREGNVSKPSRYRYVVGRQD